MKMTCGSKVKGGLKMDKFQLFTSFRLTADNGKYRIDYCHVMLSQSNACMDSLPKISSDISFRAIRYKIQWIQAPEQAEPVNIPLETSCNLQDW